MKFLYDIFDTTIAIDDVIFWTILILFCTQIIEHFILLKICTFYQAKLKIYNVGVISSQYNLG